MEESGGLVAEQPRFLAAVPALAVSDERRAVKFLKDALGFVELTHEGRGLGILRRDEVELHVWVADGSAPGAERHLAGSVSCRIEVTGVVELYEHCRELGVVHPNAPLSEKPWGAREFALLDPDNNLIALYERTAD
ncbi:MAG: VOC family protein [Jatrophihabitantaceae bacterium]